MSKADYKNFRKSRAQELRILGRILLDEGIIKDNGPFEIAAGACQASRDNNWKYKIDSLQLAEAVLVDMRMRHTRPKSATKYVVILSVSVTGVYTDDVDLSDPFEELVVNIEIHATDNEDAHDYDYKSWPLLCAWHLDKQPPKKTHDVDHFVHPVYHFQYGGQRIWDRDYQGFNYGDHLLLESPRIAHPPLDGILAIDFVLSNYYGEKWNKLRSISDSSSSYKDLLADVQHRVWRPYSIATANHWMATPAQRQWSSDLIWPQLAAL